MRHILRRRAIFKKGKNGDTTIKTPKIIKKRTLLSAFSVN